MADKLSLYRQTTIEIGDKRIASLAEDRKPRRVLDDIYGPVVNEALEEGLWLFALRRIELQEDPSVETEFGFTFFFNKPDDWVRTAALTADEYMDYPLLRYRDIPTGWLTDVDPIYVEYVSKDLDFGFNLGRWPALFERYVVLLLAQRIITPITQNRRTKAVDTDEHVLRALHNAKAKNAMNEAAPKFFPPGRFVTSRGGRGLGVREGRYRSG